VPTSIHSIGDRRVSVDVHASVDARLHPGDTLGV
jgi:hypothetical protein